MTEKEKEMPINIGQLRYSLGDVPRAMEYFKQYLRNTEEIGDRDRQGCAYCYLGNCYEKLHDLKEAIECYKQHLSIAEEIGNRMNETCAHDGLGHSFLKLHSLNEALDALLKSGTPLEPILSRKIN